MVYPLDDSKGQVLPDFTDNYATKETKDSEEIIDYTKTSLYNSLRPILLSLKICGFHYVRSTSKDGNIKQKSLKFYCWFVVSLMIIVLIINIYCLKDITKFGPAAIFSIDSAVSLLLSVMNAICFVFASEYPKALSEVCIAFSDLSEYGGPFTTQSWLKKLSTICCACCWAGWIIAILFIVFMISNGELFMAFYSVTSIADHTWYLVVTVISTILQCYFIACWIFINCLEILMGLIVYHEFNLVNSALMSKLDKSRRFQGSIENERGRYLIMSRIVEAVDSTLSFHQAASFASDVICICMQLYYACYFLDIPREPRMVGYTIFGLFVSTSDIINICISGLLVIHGVS